MLLLLQNLFIAFLGYCGMILLLLLHEHKLITKPFTFPQMYSFFYVVYLLIKFIDQCKNYITITVFFCCNSFHSLYLLVPTQKNILTLLLYVQKIFSSLIINKNDKFLNLKFVFSIFEMFCRIIKKIPNIYIMSLVHI